MGFEPTIPVFERAKKFHATVIGSLHTTVHPKSSQFVFTSRETPRCLAMAQQLLYCGLLIRGCGTVFTQLLRSNDCISLHVTILRMER
jgi:hypothetical protein